MRMTTPAIAAVVMLSFAPAAGALLAQSPTPGARVTSVDGRVELSDPAGDVQPLVYLESVGGGPEKEVRYPGFDVVKLVISSDGKTITLAATLAAPPANAAYEVIEFHIDADNNPKTGITHPDSRLLTGMEFYGALEACLESSTFGTTCAGTSRNPSGFTGVVTVAKYGSDWMFKDALIDLPAAGKVKEPQKTTIKGSVVQGSVDYASLGLESGQTIRLVAREYSAGKVKNVPQGYFGDILLTLK